jgi:hypothetical protein
MRPSADAEIVKVSLPSGAVKITRSIELPVVFGTVFLVKGLATLG